MGRPHALMLPCAAQGHINPLMQLAQHLVARHGFLVTFVNTHDNHARILHSLQSTHDLLHATATSCRSSSYPDIELVGLEPAPPSPGTPVDHAPACFRETIAHFLLLPSVPLIERLIADIHLSANPPSCIIADAFLFWLPEVVRAARITSSLIALFPSSAANLALLCHAPSLLSSGVVNPDGSLGESVEMLTTIPGLPHIQPQNVSWIVGNTSDSIQVLFDLTISTSNHLKDFDAILLNTYQELESEALDSLLTWNLQVIPIGPLILLETNHNNIYNVACSSLWPKNKDCLQWLEGRPNSSVVYVAFGSLTNFDVRDMHELAIGLEASQQTFVWVLGPLWTDKQNEVFPKGFLERVRDRALVIPWAPQSLVLSHPSIGVFITHCGWNSTMEAISIGLPMLTWPCFGDQALICQFILEQWKIGMLIADHKFVMNHHEVKNVILSIMVGSESVKIRERITKFKEEAKLALEKDYGKSFLNLQNVIGHMTSL